MIDDDDFWMTHMLFKHQVLHSLHDELGAGIHHSGKQPAEDGGGRTRREERRGGKKQGGD